MMSVTEEVAAWMAASLVGGSNIWTCQKWMLQIWNCTVQVMQCSRGSVYLLPTHKRDGKTLLLQGAPATSSRCKFNCMYQKRYLSLGAGALHTKGFKEEGKAQSQVGTGAGSLGVGVPFQHKGFFTVWVPICLPFPKNPVQVRAANPKSSRLRIVGVVSCSH